MSQFFKTSAVFKSIIPHRDARSRRSASRPDRLPRRRSAFEWLESRALLSVGGLAASSQSARNSAPLGPITADVLSADVLSAGMAGIAGGALQPQLSGYPAVAPPPAGDGTARVWPQVLPAEKIATKQAAFSQTLTIPDGPNGAAVGWDLDARSLPPGAVVTSVKVHHKFTHQKASDLVVTLADDSGTTWTVRNRVASSKSSIDETKTNSSLFAGKSALQVWHYRIRDAASSNTGEVKLVDLSITYKVLAVNPQIVGTSLSSTTARDGQTLRVGYQINNPTSTAISGQLTLAVVGPAGERIEDAAHAATVVLQPGANWYYRDLFLNLPPGASLGKYNVTWILRTGSQTIQTQKIGALTINAPRDARIPVLLYHQVGPDVPEDSSVTAADFRAQMAVLRNYGYTPITLKELMDYRAGSLLSLPAKPVLLTFDDGYDTLYTQAFPILKEFNFRATAFITINALADPATGDPGWPGVTWEQLKEMGKYGIDVQSHTVSHPHLSQLNATQLAAELVDSKQTLSQQLGKPIDFLSWPFGEYNATVKKAAWKAGYFGAMATGDQVEPNSRDKWALKRTNVRGNVTLDYGGAGPFFLNLLGDTSVAIPQIGSPTFQYTDLNGGALQPGDSVLVRVQVTNTGPAAGVIASLRVDSDADPSNGWLYDSHLVGQDLAQPLAGGATTLEWTWQVPGAASAGQYYAELLVRDQYYLLGFKNSGWQPAFTVSGSTVVLVDANLSSPTARDGQTLTAHYQITNPASIAIPAQLTLALVGPAGERIEDAAHAVTVQLQPGTNWYDRDLFLNLPPAAQSGAYDVTWTIQAGSQAGQIQKTDTLSIDPPRDVRLPVLTYHQVGPDVLDDYSVTTADFRAQMAVLKNYGYTPITWKDLMDYRAGNLLSLPSKPVMVTFDDGYDNLYTQAFPVLREFSFPATAFITINAMADPATGDPGWPGVTWEQLKEMGKYGIDVQSHTVSHPHLTQLNATQLTAELVNSRQILSQQLGKPIDCVSWPFGEYNATVEQAAWKAGYFGAFATGGQIEPNSRDKWALKRTTVEGNVTLDYGGAGPFFLTLLGDSSVAIPQIGSPTFQYTDLNGGALQPGDSVLVRVQVTNTGPAAGVIASLRIDSDADPSNGWLYDSHLVGQDLAQPLAGGATTLEWTWQVPGAAPVGQYYAELLVRDQYYLLGFKNSGWQPAFTVSGSTVVLVDANLSSPTARDGQTLQAHYQITNPASIAIPAQLTLALTGPAGERIEDAAHAVTVQLQPGTNWYDRDLFLNLPPAAQSGAYDVTWTIQAGSQAGQIQKADNLSINPPFDVRVPILEYHNIGPVARDRYWVTTSEFRAQMTVLKQYGYTPITFEELRDYRAGNLQPLPAKPVIVTFDDGYNNLYTDAFQVLKDLQIKATAFVFTEGIEDPYSPGYLTWEQLREMSDSGWVDVQSHSVSHPHLTALSDSQLTHELVDSKQLLEQELDKSVDIICWPYGEYDARVEQAAWTAGYFGAIAGFDQIEQDSRAKYALKRMPVDWHTSLEYDNVYGSDQFFLTRIGDPGPIPEIGSPSFQYVDLNGGSLQPGDSVLVRVQVANMGPAAGVIASLRIDSDANRSNGWLYDSHLVGQDLAQPLAGGTTSLEWTWQVPGAAPLGQYYAEVLVRDQYYLLGFKNSGWQPAFAVAGMSGQGMLASDSTGSQAPRSKSDSSRLPASLTAAAHDLLFAQSETTRASKRGEALSALAYRLVTFLLE